MSYDGVPQAIRAFVFRRAGGTCEGHYRLVEEKDKHYVAEYLGPCFNEGNDIAHITPKRMGGSKALDTPENLYLLCRKHHKELHGENI